MIISSYVITGETFAHLSKAPEEARKFCHFVNGPGYTTHYTHHGSINVTFLTKTFWSVQHLLNQISSFDNIIKDFIDRLFAPHCGEHLTFSTASYIGFYVLLGRV